MKVSYLINLNGIVQGVGMRPFIYRLANELSITGGVRNTASGVEIIATGDTTTIDTFIKRLRMMHLQHPGYQNYITPRYRWKGLQGLE